MSIRSRYFVVVPLVALAFLAGCASSPETDVAQPGDPSAETSGSPDSNVAKDERVMLLLSMDDMPSAGWVASNVVGSDKPAAPDPDEQPLGACAVDFSGIIPADATADAITAEFARVEGKQQLETALVRSDKATDLVDDIEAALAECTGPFSATVDGTKTVVNLYEFNMLSVGSVEIERDDAVCRDFDLTSSGVSVFGSFCFVADDDLLLSVTAFGGTTIVSKVLAPEFIDIVNAATTKAFAS